MSMGARASSKDHSTYKTSHSGKSPVDKLYAFSSCVVVTFAGLMRGSRSTSASNGASAIQQTLSDVGLGTAARQIRIILACVLVTRAAIGAI